MIGKVVAWGSVVWIPKGSPQIKGNCYLGVPHRKLSWCLSSSFQKAKARDSTQLSPFSGFQSQTGLLHCCRAYQPKPSFAATVLLGRGPTHCLHSLYFNEDPKLLFGLVLPTQE